MAAVLDRGDIAYALNSIRKTGGCIHDADILEALLEKDALPYLDTIRNGSATARTADELERMIWGKPEKPKARLVWSSSIRGRHGALARFREKIVRLRPVRLTIVRSPT